MLFVGDFAIKMTLKHNAEVLSSVPKSKRAVMCLMEKIHELHKLPSGLSCKVLLSTDSMLVINNTN